MEPRPSLRKEIERTLNQHSAENASDTPDFILAGYLMDCLYAFDRATVRRNWWYSNETHDSHAPVPNHEDYH